MPKIQYKPESACTYDELVEWRQFRVGLATLGGASAAAAVLVILGLVAQFPTAAQFGLVCAICAALCGACARLFIHIPSAVELRVMRDIRSSGGMPSGERMIQTWQ